MSIEIRAEPGPRADADRLLALAKQLYSTRTGDELSEVLGYVLSETLIAGTKQKSYSQIGSETGYSGGYLRNVAARDLWTVFSEIFKTKVTRHNIRGLLIQHIKSSADSLASQQITSLEDRGKFEGTAEPNSATAIAQSVDVTAIPQRQNSAIPWILIIDDRPENLELLTDILKNEEYQVWTATSGADALKKVEMVLPDLILLDINMPGMDGYEVCRQLKAEPRTQSIPVIFISALNESWDKVQAFSFGAADYITKPFNTLEILVRIDHQIQIGASQAQLSKLGDPPQGEEISQSGAFEEKRSDAKSSIMVVDDNAENSSLFAHLLKEEGYTVWQAKTGAEALKFAPKVEPDLILLDINLPDMTGYDVCLQLRANPQTKAVPVIFVSALDAAMDMAKGFAVGGNDYVTKPVKVLELHCRIENQLRLKQLRAQLSMIN